MAADAPRRAPPAPIAASAAASSPGATATGASTIAGDPDHPANFGRLCSKGTALGETLGLEGRLLHPVIGGRRVAWDEAIDLVARDVSATRIAEHGPDSVAFYVSGQLLTEDYYVANKLMKGFIGSANIDTNSRLCMASAVAGHIRAFGDDLVPGCYEDSTRPTWCAGRPNAAWCHPVVFQRIMAAKARPAGAPDRGRSTRAAPTPPRTPTCTCHRARERRRAVERPARRSGCATARSTRLSSPPHARACGRRRGRARLDVWSGRGGDRTCRRRAGDLLSTVRRAPRTVTLFSRAPTSRSPAPTRSTRSSTSTSPPAASASRAWARSRSPASPTPWAGARSAAWPPARRPHGLRRRRDRASCALLGRAADGRPARPQGRRPVRRGRATGGSRRCGSWPPTRRSACPTPSRCARRWRPARSWSSPMHGRHRHAALRPREAAGRRLGREGRHGHQFRAPDHPPARLPPPRARPGPTGGSSTTSPGGWAAPRLRLQLRSRHLPRVCGPTASRMTAGGRGPRPLAGLTSRLRRAGARAVAGDGRRDPGRRASSPTAASRPRRPRPHGPGAAAAPGRGRARRPLSSTPAACATTGTP